MTTKKEEEETVAKFTHRYVGDHPQELTIGDTVQMLEPHQFVILSEPDLKDPHNKELVNLGLLMDLRIVEEEGEKE